jgi:hypothetical protein
MAYQEVVQIRLRVVPVDLLVNTHHRNNKFTGSNDKCILQPKQQRKKHHSIANYIMAVLQEILFTMNHEAAREKGEECYCCYIPTSGVMSFL